jgi:hypothetical protein
MAASKGDNVAASRRRGIDVTKLIAMRPRRHIDPPEPRQRDPSTVRR